MMVRTSVRVEYSVSMRGWAIRYGTTNFHLPIPQLPTTLHLHPASSRLPYQDLGNGIIKSAPWRLRGKPRTICRTRIKRYKIPVRDNQAKNKTSGATIRTYLFPALFAAYKVGCRVEIFLRPFSGPPTWDPSHLVFQSEAMLQSASSPVRFDSDSYPIGVDSHTSRCMVNKTHLFEDLHLNKDKGQVDGISNGLEIVGKGS
jgi:hypothetical protein